MWHKFGDNKIVQGIGKKIDIKIERNRIRITIFHGEDEEIIKLNLDEAEKLTEEIGKVLEDYSNKKKSGLTKGGQNKILITKLKPKAID
jgi:hypothetical protein